MRLNEGRNNETRRDKTNHEYNEGNQCGLVKASIPSHQAYRCVNGRHHQEGESLEETGGDAIHQVEYQRTNQMPNALNATRQ